MTIIFAAVGALVLAGLLGLGIVSVFNFIKSKGTKRK